VGKRKGAERGHSVLSGNRLRIWSEEGVRNMSVVFDSRTLTSLIAVCIWHLLFSPLFVAWSHSLTGCAFPLSHPGFFRSSTGATIIQYISYIASSFI